MPLTEEAKVSSVRNQHSDINMSPYLKTLFTSPSSLLNKPSQYNFYTMLTTLAIFLFIAGGLAFIYNEGFYLNFGESLGLFLRAVFIYVLILITYGITLLCTTYISSSQTISWKSLVKSYLSLSVFALVFFALSMIFSIIGISYVPLTLNIFALVTLILGTYFIYKDTVQKHEKFDSFYVLLIHIVLTGIVTHLIYHTWMSQIWSYAFNL